MKHTHAPTTHNPDAADAQAESAVNTMGADALPTENRLDSDTVVTIDSLAEQLRQAEEKAAEHHDAWLRAKAETENVRRRAQEDIAKASKFALKNSPRN